MLHSDMTVNDPLFLLSR